VKVTCSKALQNARTGLCAHTLALMHCVTQMPCARARDLCIVFFLALEVGAVGSIDQIWANSCHVLIGVRG